MKFVIIILVDFNIHCVVYELIFQCPIGKSCSAIIGED